MVKSQLWLELLEVLSMSIQAFSRWYVQYVHVNVCVCCRLRLKGLQGLGNVSVCVSVQNRTKLYQPVGKFKDFDLRLDE